ncbi:alpha/beta hydrolase [Actinomadura keratinilytica]
MGAARSAAEREAAEESSLFGHPEAAPDTTVAYGPDPDQVVDFYAPRGPGAAPGTPLVVVVHGGAWRAAHDRLHISPFAAFLAGRGFAVASVEYRRGNGGQVAGRWPDTFDDIAAAFDALPELAAEAVPEADPGRTVLTGHSAAATSRSGPPPGTSCPPVPRGACPRRPQCAEWWRSPPSRTSPPRRN